MALLRCHPGPAALHGPSPHTLNPGKKSHPPHPCPLPKFNSQFHPIFFFPMASARLDEQSPLLCLPSLAHILIRSCRYPAGICLVSASTQMRLANRCVLQLHSLRRAHLRALTGLLSEQPAPAPTSSPRLTAGKGRGGQAARTCLPSLSSRISSRWLPGFSPRRWGARIEGWGSGTSEVVGETGKTVQKEGMRLPAQRCSPPL